MNNPIVKYVMDWIKNQGKYGKVAWAVITGLAILLGSGGKPAEAPKAPQTQSQHK